jgi:hypothetical protein
MHVTGFMLLWCTFLPFALWDICGWASPVVEGVITFLLLGIENVGIQIEEPFHILPMRAYCAGMAADVGEIVARRGALEGAVEGLLAEQVQGQGKPGLVAAGKPCVVTDPLSRAELGLRRQEQ